MALKKYLLKTSSTHQDKRLDQVLADRLPEVLKTELSKAKIRKLIVAGAVYLNGKRVRIASKPIRSGAEIQVFIDLQLLQSDSKSKDTPFEMHQSFILYEDDYLIVVDKPSGLPTQPTVDEARNNLFAAVKKYLGPNSYLGLHHRLDRDTSGVILLTKKEEVNKGIAELFSKHLIEKTYIAISYYPTEHKNQEQCPEFWSVKNYLRPIGKTSKQQSVRSGGDFAHTDFRCLERGRFALKIEAKPKTGRTHQIRVHLAEAGLPILGDLLYGSEESKKMKVPRMLLHAYRLEFLHPVTQERMKIESPIPANWSTTMFLK